MIKVLVVSYECWRDDTNDGNTLNNIFRGQDFQFANIYCKPGEPRNSLCKKYFHMTTRLAARSILKNQPCGNAFEYPDFPTGSEGCTSSDDENKKLYAFFKLFNLHSFYVMRDLVMLAAHWRSIDLQSFVREFQPDVIFAPIYASQFMLALDRYVIGIAQRPAISFIADDHYTLRQLRFSPVYWFDRFVLRRSIQRTIPLFSHVYTTTQEQAEQMTADLNCDMRILRKCMAVDPDVVDRKVHHPIRIIYAGGISFGREQTLVDLVRAIRGLPQGTARLDIYTNSPLKRTVAKTLGDNVFSFVHDAVPYNVLMERYHESDIALHAESFQKKYALQARLSFSTKIVDCLASGCAMLAICPQENAGFRFLQREGAAMCISQYNQIAPVLENFIHSEALLQQYREKAHQCMLREFDPVKMQMMIQNDFSRLERVSKV